MVTAGSSDPSLDSPQHPDDGHQGAVPPGKPQDAPETLRDAPALAAPGSPPQDGAADEKAGDEASIDTATNGPHPACHGESAGGETTTKYVHATSGSGFNAEQGNEEGSSMEQPSISDPAFTAPPAFRSHPFREASVLDAADDSTVFADNGQSPRERTKDGTRPHDASTTSSPARQPLPRQASGIRRRLRRSSSRQPTSRHQSPMLGRLSPPRQASPPSSISSTSPPSSRRRNRQAPGEEAPASSWPTHQSPSQARQRRRQTSSRPQALRRPFLRLQIQHTPLRVPLRSEEGSSVASCSHTKEKVKKEYRRKQGSENFYGNHDKTGHRKRMLPAQARHFQRELPRHPEEGRVTSRAHSNDLSFKNKNKDWTHPGTSAAAISPLTQVAYSDNAWHPITMTAPLHRDGRSSHLLEVGEAEHPGSFDRHRSKLMMSAWIGGGARIGGRYLLHGRRLWLSLVATLFVFYPQVRIFYAFYKALQRFCFDQYQLRLRLASIVQRLAEGACQNKLDPDN